MMALVSLSCDEKDAFSLDSERSKRVSNEALSNGDMVLIPFDEPETRIGQVLILDQETITPKSSQYLPLTHALHSIKYMNIDESRGVSR